MNTQHQNYTICGLELKYWIRRTAFIYIPFVLITIELYRLVVSFLLAIGLR